MATTEIDQLKTGMAALEAQRAILGDAIVDSALGPMREKLAALEAQSRADQQRKQATVLFADVSGFTAMSETMDAEEVAGVMNDLWAAVDRAITEQGGHIDKHIGDAVMALWGADTAREDDPERAVRAALAMQAAIGFFCETRGAALAMRIGINTGPVVLGAVGTTGEFTAMGDAVNLASRLEHAAPVGGVLIGHDTYRLVRGIFDVEPQAPLAVKGKAEPVQTYVVVRAKPRAFRMATRGVEGIETRMVGRDAELDTLKNAYLDAFESAETRVATFIGEAGVGKSRLLYEFDNWLELRPEHIFYYKGRSTPNTQNVPYSLFRDLFANRFEILESDPIAVALDKFRQGMAGVLEPDLADVVGHWLGFDFSSSEAVQRLLGDSGLMQSARAFLMRYFRALSVPSPSVPSPLGRGLGRGSAVPSPFGRGLGRSLPSLALRERVRERVFRRRRPLPNPSQGEGDQSQGPTVIFLEDIHWADDPSLDLAAYLATAIPAAQLLIVAVTRPSLFERRPNWGEGQAAFRRIPLTPLSKRTSRALVDEILKRVDEVPDGLRDLITDAAEGNPFYVEEMVKMLIEQGVIERDATTIPTDAPPVGAGLRPAPTPTDAPLVGAGLRPAPTPTDAPLVGAGLRPAPTPTDAPLVGAGLRPAPTSIDAPLVGAGLRPAPTSTDAPLVGAGLRPAPTPTDAPLVGAGLRPAPTSIDAPLVGAGLRPAPTTPTTGQQSWRVRTDKLATLKVPPTLTALLQARLDGLPPAEREALQRASVVGRLFWDDAVAELLESEREAVGPVLEAVRGRELIFRREQSAFANTGEYIFKHALLRDVAYETVLLKRRAAYHSRAARWLEQHAGERRDEYLTLIAEHYIQAGEGRRAADLLQQSGLEAIQSGAWRVARVALERALSLYEAAGETDSPAITAALIGIGGAYKALGDTAAAEAALERGLAGARAVGDRAAEAEVLVRLANTAGTRGDYSRAWELIEAALPLARALGGRLLAMALGSASAYYQDMGNLDAAETYATEALAVSRHAGYIRGEILRLNQLGLIAANRRQLKRAQEFYTQSLELARRANLLQDEGSAFHGLGDLAYRLGDYAAARAYGQAARDRFQELGQLPAVVTPLCNVAQAELRLGNVAAARRGTLEALSVARSLGRARTILVSTVVFAQILAEEGQTAQALALFGLSRNHKALSYELQVEIDNEVARLGLPAAEVEAGLSAGAGLDLETVVEEILEGKW